MFWRCCVFKLCVVLYHTAESRSFCQEIVAKFSACCLLWKIIVTWKPWGFSYSAVVDGSEVHGGKVADWEPLLWGKLSALQRCVSVTNLDLPWIPLVNGWVCNWSFYPFRLIEAAFSLMLPFQTFSFHNSFFSALQLLHSNRIYKTTAAIKILSLHNSQKMNNFCIFNSLLQWMRILISTFMHHKTALFVSKSKSNQ